jgi:hypothetical protein
MYSTVYLLASQPFPPPRHPIQSTVSRVNSWSPQPESITTVSRKHKPTVRRVVPNRASPRHPDGDHHVCSPESMTPVPNLPPGSPTAPFSLGFQEGGGRSPAEPSVPYPVTQHTQSPTHVRNRVTKKAREPTAFSFEGVGRRVHRRRHPRRPSILGISQYQSAAPNQATN